MAGLQGLPETYQDRLQGAKSKIFKDSVMEPGFIESLTAPEGSPIDYQNIYSTVGGRVREMFVDPMRRFGGSIQKGMEGKPLTIKDQLNLIEGMVDTTVSGLFTHGVQKGGFDPNTLHMFVGPKAKDIVKAEGMALRGASPAEIQSKMLMHKKPDGMWRKEISDAESGFSQVNFEPPAMRYKDAAQRARDAGDDALAFEMERQAKKSSDIDDYEISPWLLSNQKELYDQYPDIATMPLTVSSKLGSEGSMSKAGMDLSIFADDPKSTMFHELQHAVQQKEGWARGGSPEMFAQKKVALQGRVSSFNQDLSNFAKKIDEAKDSGDNFAADYYKKLYDETMAAKMDLVDDIQADPFDQYQNLLGEREARDTASRLGLDLEQRRGLVPDLGEGAQVLMR